MFSIATVLTAVNLDVQSISHIDNREFDGGPRSELPPGPLGYFLLTYSEPINAVPKIMLLLNNCLADGLLVCPISKSFSQVSDVDHSPSCIVVTLYMG
jgi:hypothetical protein